MTLLTSIPKPRPKPLKRKLESDNEEETSGKRAKLEHTVVDNVIMLDSEEEDEEVVLLD